SLNLYTYCGNNPIMFSDSSGHLRQPGYVNGVWCFDPDATEFGKGSATYQSLITLGNLYNGTKDSDKRRQYHELADNIRSQARFPKFKFSLIYRPTFVADNTQGIYYSPQNSLVKMFGYNDLYDIVFGVASDMNTIKMEFDNFRIQFWKSGDYKNMGLGGEMGIYTSSGLGYFGHYNGADLLNYMPVSFTLYANDSKYPVFTRYDSVHWWVNGFLPGYGGVSASDIRMIGSITLKNKQMVNSFTKQLPSSVNYTVNGLRVDYDWQ
ncbi:DUF4474 domain-containing protein, partial [Ruminiclostridium hungatei]